MKLFTQVLWFCIMNSVLLSFLYNHIQTVNTTSLLLGQPYTGFYRQILIILTAPNKRVHLSIHSVCKGTKRPYQVGGHKKQLPHTT